MKISKLMVTAALSFTAISAQADLVRIVSEKLTTNGNVIPGQVAITTIDESTKSIKLEIFDDVCGSLLPDNGQIKCLAVASKVTEIVVHNAEKKDDGCGSTLYSGVNLIPEGTTGFPTQTINITDNSKRFCEDLVPAVYVVQAATSGENLVPSGLRVYEVLSNLADIQIQLDVLQVPTDDQIWNALKVKTVAVNGGTNASKQVKSIGGLVCTELTYINATVMPIHDCTINGNLEGTIVSKKAEAIYKALAVKEQTVASGIGTITKTKTAGRLICSRTKGFQANAKPKTSCTLNSMFAL